jgi:signal recognition particle GTPase
MKINKDTIAVVVGSKLVTLNGKDVTSQIPTRNLGTVIKHREAFMWYYDVDKKWMRQGHRVTGVGVTAAQRVEIFKLLEDSEVKANFSEGAKTPKVKKEVVEVEVPKEVLAFKEFVHNSVEIRPELLKMPDLKWKYLVRSVLKGKNIMMTGPAGSGKTFAVQQLTKALNGKAKVVKKVVSREELEAMKQNMKIEIDTYKKV